jgi:hypothetical protein
VWPAAVKALSGDGRGQAEQYQSPAGGEMGGGAGGGGVKAMVLCRPLVVISPAQCMDICVCVHALPVVQKGSHYPVIVVCYLLRVWNAPVPITRLGLFPLTNADILHMLGASFYIWWRAGCLNEHLAISATCCLPDTWCGPNVLTLAGEQRP